MRILTRYILREVTLVTPSSAPGRSSPWCCSRGDLVTHSGTRSFAAARRCRASPKFFFIRCRGLSPTPPDERAGWYSHRTEPNSRPTAKSRLRAAAWAYGTSRPRACYFCRCCLGPWPLLNGLTSPPIPGFAWPSRGSTQRLASFFEVQPRVFYEGFPKYVLTYRTYTAPRARRFWKGVFLADISDAANPSITLAREGILVAEGRDRLHLASQRRFYSLKPIHQRNRQVSDLHAPGRPTFRLNFPIL